MRNAREQDFIRPDRAAVRSRLRLPENHPCAADPFHLPRIGISTNGEGFIRRGPQAACMIRSLQGPSIAVPNWLIVWSKSRDLFLSLAHNPWVYRPN